MNDWHLVDLVPGKGNDPAEIEQAQTIVLESIAERYSEEVQVGNFGAFMTSDMEADGYYVVQWTSDPYTLQADSILDEYDPPLLMRKGELVCDAKYFKKVPRARRWYTPTHGTTPGTVVRLQQVVASDIQMLETTEAALPSTCDRRTAQRLHAKKIAETDHEAILEEISMREGLDHDEEASLQPSDDEAMSDGDPSIAASSMNSSSEDEE